MNLLKLTVNIGFIARNIYSILLQKREKKIADLLEKDNLTIATAESCTGGLISSRLTDLSGSSGYVMQNLVTYANIAKVQLLGVKEETISKYGVVSREVALEMVQGLLSKYNCDIAVSTTGIAGPTGATANKPVGLICIGIGNKKVQKSFEFKANPLLCRRIMKYAFSNEVLDNIIVFLKKTA